jgi:integrase
MQRIFEPMVSLEMPIIQLTDIVARTAKPSVTQITYWDKTLPNFGLRVGRRAKAWIVLVGTERRRVTLGRYPTISLQDARTAARRLLVSAASVRRDGSVSVVPFTVALEKFVEVHLSRKKDLFAKDCERVLRKHFAPGWNGLLMHEITRAHVARVVNRLLDTAAEANNAFTVVRIFLRWSVRRGYLAHNPMELLALPVRYVPRDRVLSRTELKAVLGVSSDVDWTFGTIVLLLLLTGQRRSEIGGLR